MESVYHSQRFLIYKQEICQLGPFITMPDIEAVIFLPRSCNYYCSK